MYVYVWRRDYHRDAGAKLRRSRARALPAFLFQVGVSTTPARHLLDTNVDAPPDTGIWRAIALIPCVTQAVADLVVAQLRSAVELRTATPDSVAALAVELGHQHALATVHVDRGASHWTEDEERASLLQGDKRVEEHYETLLILG
jgi:hypothetical protein